jgi:hypothetical protein
VTKVFNDGSVLVHVGPEPWRTVFVTEDEILSTENEERMSENEKKVDGFHVQQAMAALKLELAQHGGITKDRLAPVGGGYQFRGIDDIYNVLCGLSSKHKINLWPRVVGAPVVQYQVYTKNGRNGTREEAMQTHVHLILDVKVVSSVDGSSETITTAGEAIDQGDKATNKAMSAAMKYACIMAFQIPVHGENVDIEAHDVQVAPPAPPPPPPAAPRQRAQRPKDSANEQPAPEPKAAPVELPRGDLQPVVLQPADPGAEMMVWQIAMAARVGDAKTFAEVFALAKETDPKPEPYRSVIFTFLETKVTSLIQHAPSNDVLKEAKGLIKAMGSPQPLLDAYNAKYASFRTPASPLTAGGT